MFMQYSRHDIQVMTVNSKNKLSLKNLRHSSHKQIIARFGILNEGFRILTEGHRKHFDPCHPLWPNIPLSLCVLRSSWPNIPPSLC